MRISKTNFAAIALVAVMSTLSISGASAADRRDSGGAAVEKQVQVGGGQQRQRGMNGVRSGQRMDGDRSGRRMDGDRGGRRNFSEHRGRGGDYGRRYHRNRGFGGISINLGGDGSCRYSYRKWQATGSRYWRARYYDCVS